MVTIRIQGVRVRYRMRAALDSSSERSPAGWLSERNLPAELTGRLPSTREPASLGIADLERIGCFGETPGVRLFGLGQGLEPVGDFGEALVACGLGKARVHIGVLVSLTVHCRLQV